MLVQLLVTSKTATKDTTVAFSFSWNWSTLHSARRVLTVIWRVLNVMWCVLTIMWCAESWIAGLLRSTKHRLNLISAWLLDDWSVACSQLSSPVDCPIACSQFGSPNDRPVACSQLNCPDGWLYILFHVYHCDHHSIADIIYYFPYERVKKICIISITFAG